MKNFAEVNDRQLPGADEAVHHEHSQLIGLETELPDLAPAVNNDELFDFDLRSKRGLIKTQLKRASERNNELKLENGDEKSPPGGSATDIKESFDWAKGERQLVDRGHDEGRSAPQETPPEGDKSGTSATSGYLGDGVFPTAGLALSGGGIRSAAFCTGAMQGLAAHKINASENAFGLFDYLSTVSGGGYIGATVALNSAAGKGFNLLDPMGEVKDTETMKSIRNGTNYLKFGRFVPTLYNIVVYLRGVSVNIFMAAFVLLFLAGITLLSNKSYRSLQSADFFGLELPEAWTLTPFLSITSILAAALVLIFIFWANVISFRLPASAGIKSDFIWFAAALLTIVGVAFVLELQPLVVHKMIGHATPSTFVSGCNSNDLQSNCTDAAGNVLALGQTCKPEQIVQSCKAAGTVASNSQAHQSTGPLENLLAWLKYLLAPFLALVTVFSQTLGEYFKSEETQSGWTSFIKRNTSRILVWAAGLVFLALVWVLYLYLVYWGIDMGAAGATYERSVPASVQRLFDFWQLHCPNWKNIGWLYLFSSFIFFVLTTWLHPNANSLHRLYRDRLGESFCFVQNGMEKMPVHDTKLSRLQKNRPIHIINAAINLQRSKVVKSMGRKADFFIFTPYRIGSVATGYAPTRAMEQLSSGRDIDIATATAISGAAFSSNMGSVSMKPLAPLLAFLNVRLGHWFPNPRLLKGQSMLQPSFWYLASEALGILHENQDKIYLTDGGHIENLGLFELLRRRCRFIVAVDAESDPNMAFTSFVQLQRYARIDLGARIEMSWSQIASTSLEAMSGKSPSRTGPHCAVGKIIYDNGGMGILIYVKSSVSGDENDYVREYNRRNTGFPHETTGDQFFSEEQFEVYRALGFHIVKGLLSGEHLVQTSAGLEHLDDISAKGEAVIEAAVLLGIKQKNHAVPPAEPTIHHLKMLL